MPDKSVAELIRVARAGRGVSQDAVAEALGMSAGGAYISRVENGVQRLAVHHVNSVSEFLRIPISDLMIAVSREAAAARPIVRREAQP